MNNAWDDIILILRRERLLAATSLNSGATTQDLKGLEQHLGVELPTAVGAFLSEHNGQSERAKVGVYLGSKILSTGDIRDQWNTWRSIDEEAMNAECADFMSSKPEGVVKPMYTNRLWIPLTNDFGGNHVGLDFDPDHNGKRGQVIMFGRDVDQKFLIADSFDEFLNELIPKLRAADWSFANKYREEKLS